eukprot:Amastigsp_a678623_9.p3 type:complete len:178 gc:universal Amastigsp_a678623_9:720-187(-)
MPMGEWLESTTPISGMPSFLASRMQMLWKPTSITKIASGRAFMSWMPPMSFSSFSISRLKVSCSFLLRESRPTSCWAFISLRRLIEVLTVLKLVSMPPSQRWSTKGTPARLASAETSSRAWRLVPTIRMVPRLADSCLANFIASSNIGSDFSRLMMWIRLRWPKIYGAILGFQKRVW